MRWDPEQYVRFAGERDRPFHDLLARVAPDREPRTVVDLGCGPGTLTAGLAHRWPGATVTGVDSSPEMIARAQPLAASRDLGGRLRFVEADLRNWEPAGETDVLVTAATLQWVPDHLPLIGRLVGTLAPGGWFAMTVPGNFDSPTHTLLRDLRHSPAWRDVLGPDAAPHLDRVAAVASPAEYLAALAGAGCEPDVWETTYLHVLTGEDPVLEWVRGTGARPTLATVPTDRRAAFEDEYSALLRDAYPRNEFGTILPFRRIFAVGRRR